MNEPESTLTAQRRAAEQKHVGAIRRHIFLCCDQTSRSAATRSVRSPPGSI